MFFSIEIWRKNDKKCQYLPIVEFLSRNFVKGKVVQICSPLQIHRLRYGSQQVSTNLYTLAEKRVPTKQSLGNNEYKFYTLLVHNRQKYRYTSCVFLKSSIFCR